MDFETFDTQLRAKITKYGHAVQAVGGDGWAYTVGLTPVLGYELIAIGLPYPLVVTLLNALAARLKDAEVPDGQHVDEVASVPMKLLTVPMSHPGMDRLVTMTARMGYHPRFVRQMLWPDKAGRFPDESGYSMRSQDLIELAAQAEDEADSDLQPPTTRSSH